MLLYIIIFCLQLNNFNDLSFDYFLEIKSIYFYLYLIFVLFHFYQIKK